MDERPAGGGHRQGRRAQLLTRQGRERPGVIDGISARPHGHIVAAQLRFGGNLLRCPPDDRVIEEEGFGDNLNQIDQVVMPFHVGQLVSDDGFELVRRQAHRRPFFDEAVDGPGD